MLLIMGTRNARSAMMMSTHAIGFVKKIPRLPFEIVNDCRKDCSIIPPKIKASSNGEAGKFSSLMK